jgi:hypothetical protein
MDKRPISDAVEKAGGAVVLGKKLGITHQAIYLWVRRGYAPVERAIQLEKLSGVARHLLINPKLVSAIIATDKYDAADLI